MLVGVDEAGRGPVLGSMFVAALAVSDRSDLPPGIRDSKQLVPDERDRLATELAHRCQYTLIEITPDKIDGNDRNMNELTLDATATAVTDLLDTDTARIIADACDVSETRYRDRLRAQLPSGLRVEAFHAADDSEPVVGAASILAKHQREVHVARLQSEFGEIGSGYPSDSTTRAFLRNYIDRTGRLPACARRSWSTCDDLLAAAAQGSLADF